MNFLLKTSLILFFLGGTLGPIGDMFHVASKTTGYPDHYAFYLLGIPWWVFPFFGVSGLAIGLSYVFSNNAEKPRSESFLHAFYGPVVFLFSYLLSGFLTFAKTPLFLHHLLLGSIFIMMWWIYGRSLRTFLLSIWFAFIGIVVESTLVHYGVFWYTEHDNALFGVASWLPWLYLTLSVTIGNFTHFLMKFHQK